MILDSGLLFWGPPCISPYVGHRPIICKTLVKVPGWISLRSSARRKSARPSNLSINLMQSAVSLSTDLSAGSLNFHLFSSRPVLVTWTIPPSTIQTFLFRPAPAPEKWCWWGPALTWGATAHSPASPRARFYSEGARPPCPHWRWGWFRRTYVSPILCREMCARRTAELNWKVSMALNRRLSNGLYPFVKCSQTEHHAN